MTIFQLTRFLTQRRISTSENDVTIAVERSTGGDTRSILMFGFVLDAELSDRSAQREYGYTVNSYDDFVCSTRSGR